MTLLLMASMLKKISLSGDISITKWCFVTNFFNFHYSSRPFFGGIALKIEYAVFVYKLIMKLLFYYLLCNYFLLLLLLQPSTAIVNQLPGRLVSTQIRTRGPNCFKFIIALIMPSRNIV